MLVFFKKKMSTFERQKFGDEEKIEKEKEDGLEIEWFVQTDEDGSMGGRIVVRLIKTINY